MDKNPYTFNVANPRLVDGPQRPSYVVPAAAAIFLYATNFYRKRYFRKDGNVVFFAAFALGAVPASYAHANFWLSNGEIDAGLKNNEKETSA